MSSKRYLIVNADDFGQSHGVNLGVMKAHEEGIVTSASLMVRWPAAKEAAAYRREHPELSLGLHLDLGEWAYREGNWVPVYEVVPLDDIQAVQAEVARQLDAFWALAGEQPTHLDSHQYVHRWEPVRAGLLELAQQLAVPLRDCSTEVSHCGAFYGQTGKGLPFADGISVERLIEILEALPSGVSELSCHPGLVVELGTMYRSERAQEVMVLCDPRLRAAIDARGIELCSFARAAVVRAGNGTGA